MSLPYCLVQILPPTHIIHVVGCFHICRPESKLTDEIVNGVVENLKSFAELMEKELVVLFNRARDKLDNHASSLSNSDDFKQLYRRLDEVLFLLRNAEGYRSYRCWLLCPLFSELRVLTNDVHQLMDNYENSDVTLAKFEGEVKKLDQRLLRFLESVDKHVASYDRYGSASFEVSLENKLNLRFLNPN